VDARFEAPGRPKGTCVCLFDNEAATLANPKPSIIDHDLSAPDGWGDRLGVRSDPLGWAKDCFGALSEWGKDPSIDRVVLIVIGPDYYSSDLCREGLYPGIFESLQGECRHKPMLVVLDFDDSGQYADAAEAVATNGEIFFLAAGRGRSLKTAAVLCDDPEAIPAAPGPYSIRYAICSTMFHRSFFDLVVFSSHNPKLDEIADVMNAPASGPECRGFEAVLVSLDLVSDCLRLRHFFAGPVESTDLAGVLPVRPPTGFVDDTDHFYQKDAKTTSDPLPNEFVQVQRNGSNFKLTRRGRFRPDDRHHGRLRFHIAYGAFLKPRLTRAVSVTAIVDRVLSKLFAAGFVGTGRADEELPAEKRTMLMALHLFVQRANGRGASGWDDLSSLGPYLDCWTLPQWYRQLSDVMGFPMDGPDADSCAWDESSDDGEADSTPKDDWGRSIRTARTRVLSGQLSVNEPDANAGLTSRRTQLRPIYGHRGRPVRQGPKANRRPTPKPSQAPEAVGRPEASQARVPRSGQVPKTRPSLTPPRNPTLSATLPASSDAGPGWNE
jgi:hypothetical protein